MEVLENKDQWSSEFKERWLAHLLKTGQVDWSKYNRPRNRTASGSAGVDLSQSRLMFISSAGAYLKRSQHPFDAASQFGDYTIRAILSNTPMNSLGFAHDHYDRSLIEQDPQVALPMTHMDKLVQEGQIGSIAPSIISFMGYQPDAARVVDELVPEVLALARAENVQTALLAPL